MILFVGSSLLLCFFAFHIVSGDESFTVVKFSLYLVTSLLQIYLICFYGEKLKASSLRLADKVLKNEWYNCDDKAVKSGLMLILLRAHGYAKLTAFKFVDISVDTFSNVSIN